MKLKQIFYSFILTLIITTGLPAVSSASSTGLVSVQANYVIKLKSADPEILNTIGSNIDHKIPFSGSPVFQNIYGFKSPLSLDSLKTVLAGQYDYLEIDTQLSAGAISVTQLPNDPGFSTNPLNIDRQWGLYKSGIVDAWDKTKGSYGVKVAVLDTGIDETHEDLIGGNYTSGYNVITGQTIPYGSNSDDNSHGTLVSGVIAAIANNGLGIAGALWNATLMPIKALNSAGSGSSSDIAEGIVWAADNHADVINMSLGGLGFAHDTTLADAITYAYNKNVVIVAAAGNDVAVTGGNLDVSPVFPVCDDNGKNMVVGVTATDVNDLKPDFANFGKACIDVSAPGKRILSTTNHDPATGLPAPDSYAYASGTSLAVPFVSAQAALLRSLYPNASNQQIRDRIISTADPIDNLNLSQCAGHSCAGLLGGGRINVAKSLEQQFPTINDGDVVQIRDTDTWYLINGGKKQLISPFVRNQRFSGVTPKLASLGELDNFPEGSFAEPLDGTLIKIANEPTVYYMSKGLRLPVTYQVFLMRGFSFNNIFTLSNTEVNSWVLGSFLAPPEGTLVRTGNNPTVYWVVSGVLHPINYNFWVNRGLNIFPVIYVSGGDLNGFSKGDPYIL